MTPQLILLIFFPFLLAIDIYAIVLGYRGLTWVHKFARRVGILALIALIVFLGALVDLLTQVWVMSHGGASAIVYVVSGISFIILSLAALVACKKLRVVPRKP